MAQKCITLINQKVMNTIKKIIFYFLAVALVMATSCKDEDVSVTGVKLDKFSLSLVTPSTDVLVAVVSPTDATNKAVTWSTSDPAVATVSANGEVTAVGEGIASITVTTEDGKKSAICAVFF